MSQNDVSILLVDDRRQNLTALSAVLNNPTYRLFTAEDGASALRLALVEDFAVILLDVSMPDMDGFEVAKHLKSIKRTQHVPIIFLTAVANEVANIYRAYTVGAVDYLIKPVDPDIVRRKVEVFAELMRYRQSIADQAELLRQAREREFEMRLASLRLASDERYRKLVEGIDHAVGWTARAGTWQLTFMSRQVERILGYPLAEVGAPDFWRKHLHPEDVDAVLSMFARCVNEGSDTACNHRMLMADDSICWMHTGVSAGPAEGGGPGYIHGISVEITEVKLAEQRQRFLAGIATTLSETLDYRAALPQLAQLVVPHLADWCLVDELTPEGTLKQVAGAHADGDRNDSLAALGSQRSTELPPNSRLAAVVASGEALLLSPTTPSVLGDLLGIRSGNALATLGVTSVMVIPLKAREHVLGIMTFVMAGSRRHSSTSDLSLAQEFCDRSALVLDNLRLYQAANQATCQREELLAIVSHDLRNPLCAITTTAGLLERKAKGNASVHEARVSRCAQSILSAAAQMERLIEDLLDFARIQSGQLVVHREACSSVEILAAAADMLTPLMHKKGQTLQCLRNEDICVEADRARVLQILSNLVGNAAKFSGEGAKIRIAVSAVEREAIFSVEDTGPGIPEDKLNLIFSRYWQGSTPSATSGIGLGLAIAKSLVEAQGGKIWVRSQPGVGTTFFFSLPLHVVEESETAKVTATALPQSP